MGGRGRGGGGKALMTITFYLGLLDPQKGN